MVEADDRHARGATFQDSTNPPNDHARGHRLRVTRLVLGISEQEAADAWGRSLQAYRGYEAGRQDRGQGFVDFAEKYRVSIDWMCAGETHGIGPHLAERSPGKVAILPVQGRRKRMMNQVNDILEDLPKNKAQALKVLDRARELVEFWGEPKPAPVVRLAAKRRQEPQPFTGNSE